MLTAGQPWLCSSRHLEKKTGLCGVEKRSRAKSEVFIYPHSSLARSKLGKQKTHRPLQGSPMLSVSSMQVLTDSSLIKRVASVFSSPSFSWKVYLVVSRRKARHDKDLNHILSSAEGREQTSIILTLTLKKTEAWQVQWRFLRKAGREPSYMASRILVVSRRMYSNEERRRGPEGRIYSLAERDHDQTPWSFVHRTALSLSHGP